MEDSINNVQKALLCILLAIALFVGWAVYFCYEVPFEMQEAESRDNLYGYWKDGFLTYVYKDIYIDGKHLNNYQTFTPVMKWGGQFFIPAGEAFCKALGFEYIIDEEAGLLQLIKTEAGGELPYDGILAWNLENRAGEKSGKYILWEGDFLEGADPSDIDFIYADIEKKERELSFLSQHGLLGIAEKLGYDTGNTELPIKNTAARFIISGEIMYFPLEFFTESSYFGWSYYYDEISGLYISTDPAISAERWLNENNRSYIEGFAKYMCSVNGKLSFERALDYEYFFRHEATVYEMDESFIVGLCRGEGMFNEKARNPGGPTGMMQIMPSTGRSQGYSYDDLLDPHKNIQFGTSYIRNFIRNYGGDVVKALSAYNQGSGQVASGLYNTDYALRVIGHGENNRAWRTKRGYSLEFTEELELN